ncbi:MAG TPA: 3' terminal RNA ribose 2'-O-methyltransferase Hen1, partial [Actinoplanes sp.]|nr:3' terminal RNA ribose 2'-O-methyltransferase Hen1 [Actinoplanes sp.]
MLLTVTTTHRPATDLGYLLVKHPDKVHSFAVPTGTAHVLYPEAGEDRCTAALLLDVDPQRLRAQKDSFTLGQYVNDRPYAASSLLAGALAKVFRSALRGQSKDRPELAGQLIPLEIRVPVLRSRGEAERLFGPLGWTVTATPIPLDDVPEGHPLAGDSRYVDLTLTGALRLADALNHLYVLLPVLDDAKHYW